MVEERWRLVVLVAWWSGRVGDVLERTGRRPCFFFPRGREREGVAAARVEWWGELTRGKPEDRGRTPPCFGLSNDMKRGPGLEIGVGERPRKISWIPLGFLVSKGALSVGRTEAPHAEKLAPGVSNPRGSGQPGAWMRCKTERADREDHDDVLTRVGDERERSDFGEGRRPVILCLRAVVVLQGPARDGKRRRTCDSSRQSSWR
jgi:hypothetical protein